MSFSVRSNVTITVSSLFSLFPWITLTTTAYLHFIQWVNIRKPSWIYNMQLSVQESEKPSLNSPGQHFWWILFIQIMWALRLLSEFITLKDIPEVLIRFILIITRLQISYCPLYSLFRGWSLQGFMLLCYTCTLFQGQCLPAKTSLLTQPSRVFNKIDFHLTLFYINKLTETLLAYIHKEWITVHH